MVPEAFQIKLEPMLYTLCTKLLHDRDNVIYLPGSPVFKHATLEKHRNEANADTAYNIAYQRTYSYMHFLSKPVGAEKRSLALILLLLQSFSQSPNCLEQSPSLNPASLT